MPDTNTTTIKYQCRHIFTDGRRCASPCLRGEEFCYYHHTTRKPVADPQKRRSRRTTFHIPLPEDRSAILHSIGEVLQRIAANDIDPRRAGLLLYGLQIANAALPKEPKDQPTTSRNASSSRAQSPANSQTVEEITTDPDLGILAPRAELATPESRPTFIQQLLQQLKTEQTLQQPEETPEPEIIPTLQATEDSTLAAASFFSCHPSRSGGSAVALAVARSYQPKKSVISTEAVAQWRDPRISLLLLPLPCFLVVILREAEDLLLPLPVLKSVLSVKTRGRLLLSLTSDHVQTNSSNHSGRLGLPRRDPRQRHRPRP